MPRLNSLYSRLYSIEDEFLAAIDGDDYMMEVFCDTWASLRHDIQTAEATGDLTQQVAELAHTVSARVSAIAEAFQNMDEVTQQLSNELDDKLELLVADSIQGETGPKDERYSISRSAPYIRPGYAWLLENLHNPYPSKEVKEAFAKESGSSVKLIDGWFVDVRKRIGWSKIKKERFQNKRKPLVDAATRFFVTGGHVPANLGAEFAEMAGLAKDLYSHKFFQSDLAVKLSKPPDRSPSPSQPRLPYPSPSQSPGYSSISSLGSTGRNDITNSLTTLHPAGTCDEVLSSNRKRVRLEDTPEPESRGNKRVRRESSPKPLSRCAILSPTSSLMAFQSSPSLAADTQQPSPSPSPSKALSRRRMSDTSSHCWSNASSAAGRTTALQPLSVPILPPAPSKHNRKSNSPPPIVNDSVLQGNGAVQSFLLNPVPNEATTITAQTLSRLSSVQLDYALPSMTYPLSTEVSEQVQSTVDTMDLSLLSNEFFPNYQLPPSPSDNSSLFTIPTTFEDTAPPSINNMDFTSLSGFFDGHLSDNQLLNSLSIPSDPDSIITPPMQFDTFPDFTDVDINLSSFFSTLPNSSDRLPEPLFNDLLNTVEHSTKYGGQAKKLAQLEKLRRYGTHLQECIKSLERQIAA